MDDFRQMINFDELTSDDTITLARVAAGAIAKKILREKFGVEILAYVKQVQKIIGDVSAG